jgi:hypothetical protein
MKKDKELELNLDRITFGEYISFRDSFEEYKANAVILLQLKNLYLSEKEVLEGHKLDSIEQVLERYPYILNAGSSRKNKKNSFSKRYFDLGTDYFIQPKDFIYDVFFAYRLRQLDILKIDTFLNYHILNYYDNNLQEFSRFLRICIRKHEAKLLKPETIQTVNEWVTDKEKQEQDFLNGTLEKKSIKAKKGKVKRAAQDNLTCLSQEQTVLLMHYLQQERVLLKDEYLLKLDAGLAFEILTGYSQHTLRQNLSNPDTYKTKENLRLIDHLLTRMKIVIGKDLKEN